MLLAKWRKNVCQFSKNEIKTKNKREKNTISSQEFYKLFKRGIISKIRLITSDKTCLTDRLISKTMIYSRFVYVLSHLVHFVLCIVAFTPKFKPLHVVDKNMVEL